MNVIAAFAEIERTGNLPPGFRWDSLRWDRKNGWMGWVVGPNGCNSLIQCRKLPVECGAQLDCGYLDLSAKYSEDGGDNEDSP